MLISSKAILRCKLENPEGRLGAIYDLYFDDQAWAIRYLVVEPADWLDVRLVLLQPSVVKEHDWAEHRLITNITRQQLKDSPPVDADRPVTRQKEIELAAHFEWVPYWDELPVAAFKPVEGNPHLLSIKDITGPSAYRVKATDGDVGYLDELVIDDEPQPSGSWAIRYLVVHLGTWIHGRRVLIAPSVCEAVDWEKEEIRISLARETVRGSPAYDPDAPVNRRYEEVLYDYYGIPKYCSSGGKEPRSSTSS